MKVRMPGAMEEILNCRATGRAVVMGILNVTPDSFSDGGEFLSPRAAILQAERMVAEGADMIDIGAESTRPGSERVSADEQIARLRRILPAAVKTAVPISIDTTRSQVAAFALDAGAAMINDVSAGREDPKMLALAADRGAPVVLMHMLGEPKTMQADPHYEDVVAEVRDFLRRRIDAAVSSGIPKERIIVDPGIGFGKLLRHNLALLSGLGALAELGRPVLIGPSRKRFIGELTGRDVAAARTAGTIAACLEAYRNGANIFRVHDVGPVRRGLCVADAIRAAPTTENRR